jgi:hypothetical protein
MVEQARARNAAAIAGGWVDLRRGAVESLLFNNDSFDKALAINSMLPGRMPLPVCEESDGS